ncbi:MAG TPA: TonB family protein [Usitatibacter sp.]|nr:TonB family protein [Usitatibacter sp.]
MPWLLAAALALASCASLQQAPNAMLDGKWTWTRASDHCVEVYEFRHDGSYRGVSGVESFVGAYVLSRESDPDGFFKLTTTVVTDYGGKGCGSSADSTGQANVTYLKWADQRDEYWVCYQPTLARCFGPLRRLPGYEAVERSARSGTLDRVRSWYDLNPDCSSRGIPTVRVAVPAAHGRIDVSEGVDFPNYPGSDMRHTCNIQRIPAAWVRYRADDGYVGEDMAEIEVLMSDGYVWRIVHRFAVWPTPLKALVAPPPEYPEALRAAGVEGKVDAWIYVDSQGGVARVAIRSSPSPELSRLVEAAVQQWKYEPPSKRRTGALIIADQYFDFKMAP